MLIYFKKENIVLNTDEISIVYQTHFKEPDISCINIEIKGNKTPLTVSGYTVEEFYNLISQ